MTRMLIDVPVSDVAAEAQFCREALGATTVSPEGAAVAELAVGRSVLLRICDERTHVPSAFDEDNYKKGHGPRMDLRVANVPGRVAIAVAAGARPRQHLMSETGQVVYAEVLDPFGHVWTFSLDETQPA